MSQSSPAALPVTCVCFNIALPLGDFHDGLPESQVDGCPLLGASGECSCRLIGECFAGPDSMSETHHGVFKRTRGPGHSHMAVGDVAKQMWRIHADP